MKNMAGFLVVVAMMTSQADAGDDIFSMGRRFAEGFQTTGGSISDKAIEGAINAVTPEADESIRRIQRSAVKAAVSVSAGETERHMQDMIRNVEDAMGKRSADQEYARRIEGTPIGDRRSSSIRPPISTVTSTELQGVYIYQGGPEVVRVTKMGTDMYYLETQNPQTGVSRWEMVGYYRDNCLVAAYVDRPGNRGKMIGVWRGEMVQPGVLVVESAVAAADPEYGSTKDWSWKGVMRKIK